MISNNINWSRNTVKISKIVLRKIDAYDIITIIILVKE